MAEKCVTFHSEVECVAFFDAVKEVMFVIQLLRSMKILAKYPVTVIVDNVSAIFMVSNITTMSCTKHMHIRYKHISKYVEERIVKIIFVKSNQKFQCRVS